MRHTTHNYTKAACRQNKRHYTTKIVSQTKNTQLVDEKKSNVEENKTPHAYKTTKKPPGCEQKKNSSMHTNITNIIHTTHQTNMYASGKKTSVYEEENAACERKYISIHTKTKQCTHPTKKSHAY